MDYLKSFLIGGAICLVGQLLIDKTKLTPARILVSYVVAGVILGAVGLYAPFAEFAGAGAAVPLTGFGNTLAKGVREAVDEQGFLGIFTGGLKATAGGITAAILAGLLAPCFSAQRINPENRGTLSTRPQPQQGGAYAMKNEQNRNQNQNQQNQQNQNQQSKNQNQNQR